MTKFISNEGCRILAVGAFWLLYTLPLGAGTMELSYDSIVRNTLGKNPELITARSLIAEAEQRLRGSGKILNPEFESEMAIGQGLEGRLSVGLNQKLPLTSRLKFERRLSAIDVERAKLEVESLERRTVLEAVEAFHALVLVNESRKALLQHNEWALQFVKSLAQASTGGLVSSLEAGQVHLSSKMSKNRADILLQQEIVAQGKLAEILGMPVSTIFDWKETPSLPVLPRSSPVGLDHPAIKKTGNEMVASLAEVDLAKATRWEDVGFGVFFEGDRSRDNPDGIESESLVGVRISIPLPLWQNGSAKVSEKKLQADRKFREMETTKFHIKNQAETKFRLLQTSLETARDAAEMILPDALKLAEQAGVAYSRGELPIQNLLDIRERLAEIQITEMQARIDCLNAHARWMDAMGMKPTL